MIAYRICAALTLLVGVTLMGGCQVSDDPREGGFFGGVRGVSGGVYEQRAQERRESLERLKDIQARLEQENAALAEEKASKARTVAEQQRQLNALLRDTEQLSTELNTKRPALGAETEAAQSLRIRLFELEAQIEDLSQRGDDGMRVEQLEAQRTALEEEFRTLFDLYRELGR